MTILVYDRTRSALLTALTYAITFLPWVLGGIALSGLADRLPRRQVMIASDVARMVLVIVMAVITTACRSCKACGSSWPAQSPPRPDRQRSSGSAVGPVPW
jgi:MFS family permease